MIEREEKQEYHVIVQAEEGWALRGVLEGTSEKLTCA